MLKKLKNIFAKLFKSHKTPAPQMQFAFVSGGKCYYKFTDEMKIPVARALSAQDVYTELNCKVDREYLQMFCKTVLEFCNKGKLTQVAIATNHLQSRLTHIAEIELIYKLASVVYIEENENPFDYDLAFAEQKIKHWKKHEDVDSFFLNKAISEYMPYFNNSPMSIQEYYNAQKAEISHHLDTLLNTLSESNANSDLINLVQSHKERIEQ